MEKKFFRLKKKIFILRKNGCACVFFLIFEDQSVVFYMHVFIHKLSKTNIHWVKFKSSIWVCKYSRIQNPDGTVLSEVTKREPSFIKLFVFLGRLYFCCNPDCRQDHFRLVNLRSDPWGLQFRPERRVKLKVWKGGQVYKSKILHASFYIQNCTTFT